MVRSFIASGKSDYMHELELDEIHLILVRIDINLVINIQTNLFIHLNVIHALF